MAKQSLAEQDLLKMAKEVVAESDVSVDSVNIYRDPMHMSSVINVSKYVIRDGEKKKYGFDAELSDQMIQDSSIDHEMVFLRQLEDQMRHLKEEMTLRVTVNSHDLQFFFDDGFSAESHPTGEQWAISGPVVNTGVQKTFNHGANTVMENMRMEQVPEHIKEKMMLYVMGWAQKKDPYEWMDFIQHMSEEDAERFK